MSENTYLIQTFPAGTKIADVDWSTIPAAAVNHYAWYNDYTPATTAQMVYIRDYGFLLHMVCAESTPKAVYTAYMDEVYKDSCMEFFADWLSDGRYINMEMNANAALLSCIGPDRHARTPVNVLSRGEIFPVTAEVGEDTWSVTAAIELRLLSRILGAETLTIESGFAFRGNFYKCGDETAHVHYGMWNPVRTEKPDFHRPEYFGILVVE